MQARCFLAVLTTTCAIALPLVGWAQSNKDADPKAPFDPAQASQSQLPLPSPYDKMLAIEQAADGKIDWGSVYDAVAIDVDANAQPDKVAAALALGVKIADGLVAVKSQNVEKLNNCATQIESLAKKLGASDDDLRRARLVRENANKGKWLDVFLELGFLQADIMKILAKPENANMRRLIIASGWMQGARHVTYYLSQNYNGEVSNVLREPLLVGELAKDINTLPPEVAGNPRVQGLSPALTEALVIVTVAKDQPVSKENIEKLKSTADTAVKGALGL